MSVQIKDSENVVLSVETDDAAGNKVVDTGTLTWTVDNPALATLQPNGDGTHTLVTTGQLGTVTVTVEDQEPNNPDGTPGTLFKGSLAVDIVAGPVTQVVISAGTPTARV